MSAAFPHGYALLIGVGKSAYPAWSLPVTVRDMQALSAVLTDPELCGYTTDEQHIRLLHDEAATRQAILNGLDWLAQQTAKDADATAVVYFSGHGFLEKTSGKYYLIPHDIKAASIPKSALSADDFTATLRKVQAKRLLVFIDSCRAAGMAVAKDTGDEPEEMETPYGFDQVAMPKGLVDELMQGQGRAVFTSSRGDQKSWVRKDQSLSLYTHHLIEALHGAGSRPGETVVRLSDLMYYLGKAVPASAQAMSKEQTPFADLAAEDFPVALLRGGKGLPGDPLTSVQQETVETLERIAAGITTQAGNRGVAVAGNVDDSTIVTGEGNIVGNHNVSQVVKADRGSTISGVKQIVNRK